MGRLTYGAILALIFTPAIHADEKADEIIAKAIDALGGEEKIEKFKAMSWNSRGTFYGPNGETPYEATYLVEWPNKFRFEMAGRFTMVVNADQGWIIAGGNTIDFPAEQLAEQQNTIYAGWISRIAPLKDNKFNLTVAGDAKVKDRDAVAIKVSHKDRPDVTLFFDKETHLLVKRERKGKAIDLGGKDILIEDFYSDYKEVEGYKFATKANTKRDGQPLIEAELFGLKAVEKPDAKAFEKE